MKIETKRLVIDSSVNSDEIVRKEKTKRIITMPHWLVLLGNEEIGTIDFTPEVNRYKVQFSIKEKYRDQGYCSEALKALMDKIRSSLVKVKVFCAVDDNNPACARVLIKSGFKIIEDEFVCE